MNGYSCGFPASIATEDHQEWYGIDAFAATWRKWHPNTPYRAPVRLPDGPDEELLPGTIN